MDIFAKVTVLAYFFWNDDGAPEAFGKIAYALEQTWRWCGHLRSVLVVNKRHECVERFGAEHDDVTVQVEPTLQPGSLYSMSVDCISRLHSRFETDYVLIVQDDGYPLRAGLEEFVGMWDFVGAPHVRNRWYLHLASRLLGFHPMNGGFSLRSKLCCEAAARLWTEKYHVLGDCPDTCEDWFYTGYLPKHEPSYKRQMRFPDVRTALRFSYEYLGQKYSIRGIPLGFHREKALEQLGYAK